MTIENNTFKTSDTALAAYLITEGYKLNDIDYSLPRFEFNFPHSTEIQELASKYLIGKALTDPAIFNKVNRKLLRCVRQQIQWGDD